MTKQKIVLTGGPARNAKRIVLAGGCFDILHIGHVRFLKKQEENREKKGRSYFKTRKYTMEKTIIAKPKA